MKDNVFRKKLNEMGKNASEKIEKLFDGATNNAHEFVEKFKSMSNKTRLKVVKSVGAGVMSLLILCGFTGCMDDLGNIFDTDTPNITQVTNSQINDVTIPSSRPQLTTKPAETSNPEETTKKPDETTKKPDETSKPEETTTPNSGTVVTPKEDLPADADGYRYPEFFYNLVNKTMADAVYIGNGINYQTILKKQTPEIIFVERGEYTDYEETPIVIYAKYCTNPNTNEFIYTRLSFKTGGNDYGRLGRPSRYSSYAEYIAAVQAALEKKAEILYIDVSSVEERQDALNDKLGANYAKCLGANFVDATVNHARMFGMSGVVGDVCEVSGFAYDKDGTAYSYTLRYQLKGSFVDIEFIVDYLQTGRMKVDKDFKMFEVTSMPVAGVFTEQVNEQ